MWAFSSLHTAFALLLGQVYAFAPDERTYMAIAREINTKGFITDSVLGWRHTQVWFLQIAYLPERFLSAIGVPQYFAIRFLSIVLSSVSVYLVLCILNRNPQKRRSWFVGAMLLIPSCFLWMTLGLRESFIFLSLALICMGLYLFSLGSRRGAFVFLIIGNLVIFETKAMLFLMVAGALALTLVFSLIKSRGFRLEQGLIVAAVAIPLVIFPVGSKVTYYTVISQFVSVTTTGQASIAKYAESITSVPSENVATTTDGLRQVMENQPNNPLVRVLKLVGLDKKLAPATSASGSAAVPEVRSSRLDVVPAQIKNPISILARSGGFLFTPFPLIDNGSLFINLLALEAPLWWLLYGAFGIALWRRFASKSVDQLTVFILSFSVAFLLFSALTEINVGTLTRHRSVLLIPILFIFLSTPKKSPTA